MTRKASVRLVVAGLLAVTTASILYKVLVLDYTFVDIIPQTSYQVELSMHFAGTGDDVVVRTFLPASDERQTVSDETSSAPGLDFSRESTPLFVRGEWIRARASGPHQILYSFRAQIRPVTYSIPGAMRTPDTYPQGFEQYLKPTEVIQTEHPAIREIGQRILPADRSTPRTLKAIYDQVLAMGSRPFKGTTDAVTAAKLGEASCNGKSRLFIALARRAGIPSRLVGGVILATGSKRTSHQWVEAWVGGHWVPFDGLNGHFASLPGNYLALYRGDEALFVHSRNIGFDYRFDIRRRVVTNDRMAGFLGGHAFNLYRALQSFRRVNISLNILQFLLVIPLGVLVVVLSRNVFGIRTFGTFLPALMAMAARETGLLPGIAAFLIVLAVGLAARWPLDRLGILHTPKLAILMIVVVFTLLGLTVVADLVRAESTSTLGAASLFPIAILTITTERIALMLTEEGPRKTLTTVLQTLLVTSACYGVMSSLAIQALMLAFPELLLAVAAMNLGIGTWTGLRVAEMMRFGELWSKREEPTHG